MAGLFTDFDVVRHIASLELFPPLGNVDIPSMKYWGQAEIVYRSYFIGICGVCGEEDY